MEPKDTPETWPPQMGLAWTVAEILRGRGEDIPEELPPGPGGGLRWALEELAKDAWAEEEPGAQFLSPDEEGDYRQ